MDLLPKATDKRRIGKLVMELHDVREKRSPLVQMQMREKLLRSSAAQQALWERQQIERWLSRFTPPVQRLILQNRLKQLVVPTEKDE